MRATPARMADLGSQMAKQLAIVAKSRPEDAEAARAAWRLAAAERRIIAAHGPVVILDAAQKRLVTEHSLLVLRDAAAWTAQTAGLPGPDDTFIDRAGRGLRLGYPGFSKGLADGFAHSGVQAGRGGDVARSARMRRPMPAYLGAS